MSDSDSDSTSTSTSSHDRDRASSPISGNDSSLDTEADALSHEVPPDELSCPCTLFYALARDTSPRIRSEIAFPQHSAPIHCVIFLDHMLFKHDWSISPSVFISSGLHPLLCQFQHRHATTRSGFFFPFVSEVITRINDSAIPESSSSLPPYRSGNMHHTLVSIDVAAP